MIYRGELTDAVLAAVATCGFPVGDAEAPAAGGWEGEPNKSDFVPYTVVTPMSSSSPITPLGGGPQSEDVVFSYTLTSFGVSRRQCEHIADAARQAVLGLTKTNIGTGVTARRIRVATATTTGQVTRIDSVEPAFYAQTDTFTLNTTQ